MRALIMRAAAVAVLLPAAAGAQSFSLTEAEALARLSAEAPHVRAARAAVDAARSGLLAPRWPNPRVTFNREAAAGVAEHMLMVSQVLPLTGQRGLERQAASARVDASSSRADEQIRRLRADLRLAFTDLSTAQRRERTLAQGRDRLQDLAAVLARREDAGESAGFDRLRAEREVIEVATDRASAVTARSRAQASLVSFFAEPIAADSVEAIGASPPPQPLPPLEAVLARAESSRPALAALARELEAAAFTERAASRQAIPEPEVVAGTKSSNAGNGDLGSVLSVHVAVPLFDRARPERAAARARATQLRAEMEVVRRAVRADVTAWHAALLERRETAERYRMTVTDDVAAIEQIARVSYEAGERTILELLDAYRTAADARLRQITLDAAVREAEIELEFISGWELP